MVLIGGFADERGQGDGQKDSDPTEKSRANNGPPFSPDEVVAIGAPIRKNASDSLRSSTCRDLAIRALSRRAMKLRCVNFKGPT